jgi:tRNA A-37 threonylcarbamoyl transferase component Bud32
VYVVYFKFYSTTNSDKAYFDVRAGAYYVIKYHLESMSVVENIYIGIASARLISLSQYGNELSLGIIGRGLELVIVKFTETQTDVSTVYTEDCVSVDHGIALYLDARRLIFLADAQQSLSKIGCSITDPGTQNITATTQLHGETYRNIAVLYKEFIFVTKSENEGFKLTKILQSDLFDYAVDPARLSNYIELKFEPLYAQIFENSSVIVFGQKQYIIINPNTMKIKETGKLNGNDNNQFYHWLDDSRVLLTATASGTITVSIKKEIKSKLVWKNQFSILITVFIGTVVILILLLFVFRMRNQIQHRKKKQKEIELRLLESEVEIDPNKSKRSNTSVIWIPIEELTFDGRVSEGASGVVYRGTWKRTQVAIKRAKITDEDAFLHEAIILNTLRHPNVVLFCGLCQDDGDNRYIVTEFVPNGGLDTFMYGKLDRKQLNQTISFSEKIRILSQIAQGMIYLHSIPIIHRDLKPQNILLDAVYNAKICDFGVSKFFEGNTMTGVSYGTLEYMSPEILLHNSRYDEKCDVYSFGIMMHELFFLIKPYHPLSDSQESSNSVTKNLFTFGRNVEQGIRPEIPFSLENPDIQSVKHWFNRSNKYADREFNLDAVVGYMNICINCWDTNPQKRPTFELIYDKLSRLHK